MTKKGKTILLTILGIIVVVVLFVGVSLWQSGVFSSPELKLETRPAYLYIYLERSGPFSEINKAKNDLQKMVKEQKLPVKTPCGVYFDDPAQSKNQQLRWRIGYTVEDSLTFSPPLKMDTIPAQRVIVASIKAHPMVAPFKTYPALEKWVAENGYRITGPAYEFYYDDGLVEAMFPVEKR